MGYLPDNEGDDCNMEYTQDESAIIGKGGSPETLEPLGVVSDDYMRSLLIVEEATKRTELHAINGKVIYLDRLELDRDVLAYTAKNRDNQFSGKIDCVMPIESGGFHYGTMLSVQMAKPLIRIRRPGKSPSGIVYVEYERESGRSTIGLNTWCLEEGRRIRDRESRGNNAYIGPTRGLIVDDIIGSGGTAVASLILGVLTGFVVTGISSVVGVYKNGTKELMGQERIIEAVKAIRKIDKNWESMPFDPDNFISCEIPVDMSRLHVTEINKGEDSHGYKLVRDRAAGKGDRRVVDIDAGDIKSYSAGCLGKELRIRLRELENAIGCEIFEKE